jgi:hypothetical protein
MGTEQYPRVYLVEARVRRDGNAIALSPLAIIISVGFLSLAGLTYKAVTPSAKTSAASVMLFDKDKKVIWRAP